MTVQIVLTVDETGNLNVQSAVPPTVTLGILRSAADAILIEMVRNQIKTEERRVIPFNGRLS